MSAPVSAGPFVLSIIGAMDIDGEERRGLFLSGDVQKLRGLGAFLGDDVYLSRADIAADLLAALEEALEVMQWVDGENDCSRGIEAVEAAIARAKGAA